MDKVLYLGLSLMNPGRFWVSSDVYISTHSSASCPWEFPS